MKNPLHLRGNTATIKIKQKKMDNTPILKPSHNAFRGDINGLRAWAVMAVVFYHFGVLGFDGGFVGVDIFFVISGFLMTGIITKGISNNTLSFLKFYLARAKRIIPALLAVCITLLILGWFFLPSTDYKTLASHSVYSLFFVSNFEYWLSAGYFDAESHEKWLLHTWSLAVEWQFYMALPPVMWAAWKIKPNKNALIGALALIAFLSFFASAYYTAAYPTASFYLLHTRAWELVFGGLLFFVPSAYFSHHMRRGMTMLGLILIVASITALDKTISWPGTWAALPVVGTGLVILSQHRTSLTHHRIAQWLGDRSYSIYLWHWPVFVTLVLLELRFDTAALAGGIFLSIVLGSLSYSWIEKPTKTLFSRLAAVPSWAGLISAATLVSVLAVVIWKFSGFPDRMPEAVEVTANEQHNKNKEAEDCHLREGTTPNFCMHGNQIRKILLVGDSHAQILVSPLTIALPDFSVIQSTYSGCPLIQGMKRKPEENKKMSSRYDCFGFNLELMRELNEYPPDYPVLLAGRYAIHPFGYNELGPKSEMPTSYFKMMYAKPTPELTAELSVALTKTACDLAKGRKVFMLRPTPEMGINIPRASSVRIAFGLPAEISISQKEYKERNAWVWQAQDAARDQCGIVILDGTNEFCDGARCYGSKKGRPIYFDDDHLSEYGNKLLVPAFKQILEHLPATP